MRRSWAEVVRTTADPPSPQARSALPSGSQTSNQISKQLAAIAEKLHRATGGQASGPPSGQGPAQQTPTDMDTIDGAGASEAAAEEPPSRQQLLASVKHLEAALAAIPAGVGDDATRDMLAAQLDEKRRLLGETKPMGKRLDGARAALARALKRQEAAVESVQLALAAQEASNAEVTHLRAEVASLEEQIGPPAAPVPATPAPVMEQLESLLQQAVAQLAEAETVSGEAVSDASAQSAALLERFKATLDMVKRAEEPQRRLVNKQPPLLVPDTHPRGRRNGKQAPPMVISDTFVKHKGLKPGFQHAQPPPSAE